tara:strand:+ start:763 stop:981 length:219 start_codon:yes stop_codon:yes gene_type:complete
VKIAVVGVTVDNAHNWLELLRQYEVLLDAFRMAQWDQKDVRHRIASVLVAKTMKYVEANYDPKVINDWGEEE